METFGQCVYAWMQAQDLSVPELMGITGYKSKTSLYRVLQGQCNYSACVRFYDKLFHRLDSAWQDRMQASLRAEKIGLQRTALYEAIHRTLFQTPVNVSGERTFPPQSLSGGTVFLFGASGEAGYTLAESLIAADPQVQIRHYITKEEILSSPSLLAGLIGRIRQLQYQAVLLDEKELRERMLTWNAAIYCPEGTDGGALMLFGQGNSEWQSLERISDPEETLRHYKQTPLYRFDQLMNPSDYIELVQTAYQMERGRESIIVKPTPGIQMIPPDIVENAFDDFISKHFVSVSVARESLYLIQRKRIDNFFHNKTATQLFLSKAALAAFARTGMLMDQFFAIRRFTREERIRILKSLAAFAQESRHTVGIMEKQAPDLSIEIYHGKGALLYPSDTHYHAEQDGYRELFLPGNDLEDLFAGYVRDILQPETGADQADKLFNRLIHMVQNEQKD